MPGRHYSWDDYFYPGTEVLKNKLGTRDPELLRKQEEARTAIRAFELYFNPIEGEFDYAHLKAIHAYLFQDIYEWAGEERTAPVSWMSKPGPDVVHYSLGDPRAPEVAYAYFPAGPALREHANQQFRIITAKYYFADLSANQFCSELAEVWGELNVAHPFREGNTRTQSVFFSQLAQHAGHPIDVGLLAEGQLLRDEFVAARFYCQATGDSSRLVKVIEALLIK